MKMEDENGNWISGNVERQKKVLNDLFTTIREMKPMSFIINKNFKGPHAERMNQGVFMMSKNDTKRPVLYKAIELKGFKSVSGFKQ